MSTFSTTVGLCVLLFGGVSVSSQNCNGCSSSSLSSCVNLVDDGVYGCYGSFSSGVISDSALNLCKRGNGYHLCESANEAELLGLTINDCQNKVPSGHHFWSLESSVASNNLDGECYSNTGPVTYNDRPRDDVWACASSSTDISNCGSIHNSACGPLNKACDAPDSGSPWEEDGLWMCPCEDIELFTIAVTDATVGGSLCCSDTIPTDLGSTCSESITIWRINPGFTVPTPNFAPYVGVYTYYGNTGDGYPRYVLQKNGNIVSELSLSLLFNRLVMTLYTDYDVLYSRATTIEDGVVENLGNNRFGIVESFFSPGGTDMTASETNDDQISFYNPDVSTDSNNFIEDFQIIATFSDCPYYGLEKTESPSSSDTSTSSPPLPTSSDGCPNYDDTVYSSCSGDANCANCQPWGCAQCNTGYYKMGNLDRCQSCTSNYPNCAQCSDWNGCVSCNYPYHLQWNGECGDETCQ